MLTIGSIIAASRALRCVVGVPFYVFVTQTTPIVRPWIWWSPGGVQCVSKALRWWRRKHAPATHMSRSVTNSLYRTWLVVDSTIGTQWSAKNRRGCHHNSSYVCNHLHFEITEQKDIQVSKRLQVVSTWNLWYFVCICVIDCNAHYAFVTEYVVVANNMERS